MIKQVKFSGLETQRLTLRDFKESDLVTFATYRNDPQVARYQSWESYDLAQARQFFAQQQALAFNQPDSWYQIAIIDKTSDEMLGDCVIHFLADDNAQVEIGFTLATKHQGHGYGKEAIGALLDFIFLQLNKRRVIAVTDVKNNGSIHLLEGLGFRQEGHFVENILFKGCWGSEYLYALLRREFVA